MLLLNADTFHSYSNLLITSVLKKALCEDNPGISHLGIPVPPTLGIVADTM